MSCVRAAPNFSVYAACKAAMLNFTRTLSVELADHGIRVNAIAPDYTSTPGIDGIDDPGRAGRIAAAENAIPLGRRGDIEETAGPIVFLCSRMAGYVTGATLPVDGGTWASGGWIRDAR